MKIIEIATGYTSMPVRIGAATEIVIENLLKGLNNLQVENELIDVSFSDQKTNIQNYLPATRIHKIRIPKCLNKVADNGLIHIIRRIIYSIKVGFFLKKYLKSQDAKESIFLHFHNQFNFFFTFIIARTIIRRRSINLLYTIHTPTWTDNNKPPRKLILEKFSISHAHLVICLTNVIKDNVVRHINGLKSSKIVVIPNGVNSDDFYPINGVNKKKQILNIGSVCERKNQLGTIISLKKFLEREDFKFVFAGKIIDSQYFLKIQSYIEMNGLQDKVLYEGEVEPGPALNYLYNSSAFYVSHSKNEAFSLVILESICAGLPVLLSKNFSVFLENNRLLYNVIKIPEDISTDLLKMTKDQAAYEGYRERQMALVQQYYQWDSILKKMIKEITNLKNY